ncbi:MAG: YhbY family RNA-binding protein [Betaproteobacteria bacterium]|nr:YhbY family RNA-binding protein [Betaproteobacteria bacterium]
MKEAPRPSKAHRYAEQLTSQQRSALKGKAHHLKPVVQVGAQGLSESVLIEIKNALQTHELIKLQLPGQTDASEKKDALAELEESLPERSFVVGRIGRTVILYLEKNPEEALCPLKSL